MTADEWKVVLHLARAFYFRGEPEGDESMMKAILCLEQELGEREMRQKRKEAWSADPMQTCPFHKWLGVPWTEVVKDDPDYVRWLLSGAGPMIVESVRVRLENLLSGDEVP